jgi:hypothetical protein
MRPSLRISPEPEPIASPFEKLDRAFRTVITVPKEALLKEEAKLKRAHARKKLTKKTP